MSEELRPSTKAVVHVSGSMLRQNWYSDDLTNCIIVRPSGERRDSEGYLVHQVRFSGPTNMIFGAQKREAGGEGLSAQAGKGHVGTLPGFDNSIMVWLEADEKDIHVQLNEGDEFVALNKFKDQASTLKARTINPMREMNC